MNCDNDTRTLSFTTVFIYNFRVKLIVFFTDHSLRAHHKLETFLLVLVLEEGGFVLRIS